MEKTKGSKGSENGITVEELTPQYVAKKIQGISARMSADEDRGHRKSTPDLMEKAYWWALAEEKGDFFYRRVSEILVSEAIQRNCAGILIARGQA